MSRDWSIYNESLNCYITNYDKEGELPHSSRLWETFIRLMMYGDWKCCLIRLIPNIDELLGYLDCYQIPLCPEENSEEWDKKYLKR